MLLDHGFVPGQYPPALQKILAEKKDFAQLEDFNNKKGSAGRRMVIIPSNIWTI